jgi:hypothetical protein
LIFKSTKIKLRFLNSYLRAGEWRRLHNEELYDLYSSPSIIRVRKSRRISWAGHVARIGVRKVEHVFGGEGRGKETTWKT